MRLASALVVLGASLLLGCGSTTPPARTPAPDGRDTASGAKPGRDQPAPEDPSPRADVLPALADNVPEPAATCPSAGPLPPPQPCGDAWAKLAQALATTDGDTPLRQLEACSEIPAGVVRALRAERAPRCADALVLPVVGAVPSEPAPLDAHAPVAAPSQERGAGPALSQPVRETLVALGLAARLSRTVKEPPEVPSADSRSAIEAYLAEALFPWATAQSAAIHAMAQMGARLTGYARALVAIEAGMADMRFVEMARAVPLPREMREDPELRDIYYASLDEALEPRKTRGRDAALVGLLEFSDLGITVSARLDTARQLISRVYAGNRIAALDALLTPPLASCPAKTSLELIAVNVETPYAEWLLSSERLTASAIDCVLTRGLPMFLRQSLANRAHPEDLLRLGRGYYSLGRAYFAAPHFQRAEAQFSQALDAQTPDETGTPGVDPSLVQAARLERALSVALMAGPASPPDLFRLGPRLPDSLGNLALLDGLAEEKGPLSGLAAFDAAYIRELSPPAGSPSFWRDLARRYLAAAERLSGDPRQEAMSRSRAASDTANALAKKL